MADELRADIAAARSRMRVKIGSGREIRNLEGNLWEGETVRAMTRGLYGKGQGLIVLTDRRLFFTLEGIMSKTNEDFPFDRVSSVSWSSGLALGTITIFSAGNKAEIKNVNKADGKEMVDAVRGMIASPQPGTAHPTTPGVDVGGQLSNLAGLHAAGALTDAEFAAAKARLLG